MFWASRATYAGVPGSGSAAYDEAGTTARTTAESVVRARSERKR